MCPWPQLADVSRQSLQNSGGLLEAQRELETAVRLAKGQLWGQQLGHLCSPHKHTRFHKPTASV